MKAAGACGEHKFLHSLGKINVYEYASGNKVTKAFRFQPNVITRKQISL